MARLTSMQVRFLVHYQAMGSPTFGNATRAAAAAGYRWPRQQGSRLLSQPKIKGLAGIIFDNQLSRLIEEASERALAVQRARRAGISGPLDLDPDEILKAATRHPPDGPAYGPADDDTDDDIMDDDIDDDIT